MNTSQEFMLFMRLVLFISVGVSIVLFGRSYFLSSPALFIKIDEAYFVIEEADSTLVNFKASPQLGSFVYTSNDTSVARFIENRLIGVEEGSTTIVVSSLSDPTIFQSINVIVREKPRVMSTAAEPVEEEMLTPDDQVETEIPINPTPKTSIEPEVPVVEEPEEEVVTPSNIYTITITNETGSVITTLNLEAGSLITTSSLDLPENFKGFFLSHQTCDDEPFDLDTPITENLTLIQASFNDQAPCIQLDYIVLNGRPVAGSTLSVDVFPLGANVTISWYTSVNNRTYREIPGETESTFTVRPEDSGKFIRVYVVSDSNPPVVRYDTIKLDVFGTLSNGESGGPTQLISDASITALLNQGYIPISSLEDMQAINSPSSHVFASNTNLALTTEGGLNKNYVVINDIDLSAYTGITSVVNGTFTGTFDGNGYTVSDLTINATNIDNMGLFSQISGASIQNLTLQAFNITGNEFVGALAAKVNGTGNVISNIQLLQSQVGGYDFIGGLIGRVEDADLTMTNITNNGMVIGNSIIGGMIGWVDSNVTLTMAGITNTGDVNGSNEVGGMIGWVDSNVTLTMTEITNTGAVSGSYEVGGMIGFVFSNVTLTMAGITNMTDVTNTGDVSGSNQIGGMIGFVRTNVTLTMAGITNSGDVSGSNQIGGMIGRIQDAVITMTDITNTGAVNGSDEVGGMIGWVDSNVTLTMTDVTNAGAVSGSYQIGGMIGRIQDADVTMTNVTNTGAVNGSDQIGGMIGFVFSNVTLTMTDVTNTGDVSGSDHQIGGMIGLVFLNVTLTMAGITNTGDVSGSEEVGGMIGIVLDADVTMTNVTNTGAVNGSDEVGGMIGYTSGTLNINQSINHGSVFGTGDEVGGFVGDNEHYFKALGSTNYGSVTGASEVGGILGDTGSSQTEIISALNYGDVTANGSGSNSQVGGLMGDAADSSTDDTTILNSANFGTVQGNARGVGGLVGEINEGTVHILGSFNAGLVHATNYNSGTISGTSTSTNQSVIGGLLGDVSSSVHIDVISSYNYGIVTGSGTVVSYGAIIGRSLSNHLTLAGIFYLDTINEGISMGGFSGTISGTALSKTSTDLKIITTFSNAGWDIASDNSTTWTISYYGVDSYPWLQWRNEPSNDQVSYVYFIRTPEDLKAIENDLSGNYIILNDIDLSGYGVLNQSFINGTFTGNLSGQGFTISNLIINAYTNYIGLFSQISGASITELTLENFNISGRDYVGTLVGSAVHSTFTSIQLISTQVAGFKILGGMVGQGLTLTMSNSAVLNMTLSGIRNTLGGLIGQGENLTLNHSTLTQTAISGDWKMGGLVGEVLSGFTTISNTVMTDTTVAGGRFNVGGMIGILGASATITNSTLSNVNITGSGNVGGLVGLTNGTVISHAVVDGNLSGSNPRGIVGNFPTTATITNASFTGTSNGLAYSITYP